MGVITADYLRQRKAELEAARDERWAELNQVLGALSTVDALLAELEAGGPEEKEIESHE